MWPVENRGDIERKVAALAPLPDTLLQQTNAPGIIV
jgi:hypothetical protein